MGTWLMTHVQKKAKDFYLEFLKGCIESIHWKTNVYENVDGRHTRQNLQLDVLPKLVFLPYYNIYHLVI